VWFENPFIKMYKGSGKPIQKGTFRGNSKLSMKDLLGAIQNPSKDPFWGNSNHP
jgi:hypothetical protein